MSPALLTLDTVIKRTDTLLSTALGGDVVMMDVEQGAYYGLEAVAARIWTLTEQPLSIGALCERLVNEYQVTSGRCQEDVLAFLGELLSQGIVQVVARSDAA